ncbi:DUF2189 domain-containing protein [Acuticoccus sp.]|uniref:DUF2189 domain-containing protein n=1 Tax=Acuticoccus sp. TaxID=1904378 RepID=UPI003B51A321
MVDSARPMSPPVVATIERDAIAQSLREGFADFMARPTTAIFVIVVYPFIGLLMYRFAFDRDLLPLLFPIASGFALVGPLSAAGLYEISRRREAGAPLDGVTAYGILSRDKLVPLVLVGALLLVIYLAWIGAAQAIYGATLGNLVPESVLDLLAAVFTTTEGWTLLVVGCGVGFVFALVVLAIGAISLPAIVDRGMAPAEAVALSVSAFVANPGTMLAWGFVIALGLAVASLPLFLGLVVVLPIFGHATWHLYRKLVPR